MVMNDLDERRDMLPFLKPCPFCGGEAYYRTPEHQSGTAFDVMRVECKSCGASPYSVEAYMYNNVKAKCASIAEIWNKRIADAE